MAMGWRAPAAKASGNSELRYKREYELFGIVKILGLCCERIACRKVTEWRFRRDGNARRRVPDAVI